MSRRNDASSYEGGLVLAPTMCCNLCQAQVVVEVLYRIRGYARVSGRHWRLVKPPEHLFYFSKRTLTDMLERTGFEVLEVTYPWKLVPWLLLLYQISQQLRRMLGSLGSLPFGLCVNLFDAMSVIGRKRPAAS